MGKLNYEKALEYAAEKHRGQYRIGGEPYITHPVAAAQLLEKWGFGTEYQITALFHDLLEDTDAEESEILALSNKEVLKAVKILTKVKPYVMSEYVAKIKDNELAFAVKTADRLHNLKSAFCTDEEFKRKYILETLEYYMDFSPEIEMAVRELSASMDKPVI